MAKTQANFPTSLDVLNTDREAGQVITSASYDVIEDAITEIEAWLGIVKTGSGAIVCTTAPTITTINLTGGQIAFPATAAPSADANTLDDYEEGTWTVTMTCSTSGTITLSTNTGYYTKIGRVVHIQGYITVASVSSPLGVANISLPFSAAYRSPVIIWADNLAASGLGVLVGDINATNMIQIYKFTAGVFSTATAPDVQATTDFWFNGTYII